MPKNLQQESMIVRFVEIDSSEYLSLCDLRYRVFFQEHRLPREIIFDQYENTSWYAVIEKLAQQLHKFFPLRTNLQPPEAQADSNTIPPALNIALPQPCYGQQLSSMG